MHAAKGSRKKVPLSQGGTRELVQELFCGFPKISAFQPKSSQGYNIMQNAMEGCLGEKNKIVGAEFIRGKCDGVKP